MRFLSHQTNYDLEINSSKCCAIKYLLEVKDAVIDMNVFVAPSSELMIDIETNEVTERVGALLHLRGYWVEVYRMFQGQRL